MNALEQALYRTGLVDAVQAVQAARSKAYTLNGAGELVPDDMAALAELRRASPKLVLSVAQSFAERHSPRANNPAMHVATLLQAQGIDPNRVLTSATSDELDDELKAFTELGLPLPRLI